MNSSVGRQQPFPIATSRSGELSGSTYSLAGRNLTGSHIEWRASADHYQGKSFKHRSLCKKIRVNICTDMFHPEEAKYANAASVGLPYPTNDVRLMTKAATEVVNWLLQEGLKYSKAEVLLLDLRQPSEFTDDLFSAAQPEASEKVMRVLYQINGRWGPGTLRVATVPAAPDWGCGGI